MAISRVLYGFSIAIIFLIAPGSAAFHLVANNSSSFSPQQFGDFWLSEGRNYTFGFKNVGHATDPAYLLSIWHSGDPNQTAIWWPNFGDDPVVKDGASFNLTSTGILQLYNASSMLVWSSSNTGSSIAELQDTGNLRLLKDNQVVWQSFDDRRDSLMLAGLDNTMVQNKPHLLQSRRNQSSYGVGRFHLATDNSLILSLYGLDQLNNQFLYFSQISMNASGGVVIGQRYHNRNPSLDRLALDYDGNLRVYMWQSNVSSWQAVWTLIYSTKCKVGSPCGPFGICSEDATAGEAVKCSCPPGYHARIAGSYSQGCASNMPFNASCGISGSTVYNTTILELPSSDYHYNDLTQESNVDVEQCKLSCLTNCACMAATHLDSSGMCYLKGNSTTGYLMNGYSTDADHTLLIKVVSLEPSGRIKGSKWLIGVGVAAMVVVVGGVGCAWMLWQRRSGRNRSENEVSEVVSGAGTVRFTYQELVEATENFRHQLGKGGFGVVYKGWVRGKRGICSTQEQQVVVAVKMLKGSDEGGQREKQFRAEVSTLGKIHHINLVSLLGYCAAVRNVEKRLLVYEYMENGSLDRFLSAAQMQQPLPWPKRYSIALGIARGIAYLHDDCNPRILHCDIKPQNVLLDHDFTAKVADFGLARHFRHRESHLTMSGTRGTRGYMAPEWIKSEEAITSKVDVYSFGMLLLELVNGLNTGTDHMPLLEWACQCISARELLPVQAIGGHSDDAIATNAAMELQPRSREQDNQQQDDQETVEKLRVLKVALWCVQIRPSSRPSMSRVVQEIQGTVAMDDPPNPTLLPSRLPDHRLRSTSNNSISYSVLSPR